MGKIIIDPVTRIEGHLKIEAVVEDKEVKEARSSGTLFRGMELILRGRDPRDAQRITQRICGVCPTSHSTAATLNLDSAFGIADKIPDNGRIIRNLILGAAHDARILGIDLSSVHKIVLSHGHNDHIGGLQEILRETDKIEVIAHPDI